MLMQNASKALQLVVGNVDHDVWRPMLNMLYDMIMLTDDTGTLRGDEDIEVLGVDRKLTEETNRQRQLEFLRITGNPIDVQITGMSGRAAVLKEVANGMHLPDTVVPDPHSLPGPGQPPMGGPPGAPGPAPPGAAPPGGGGDEGGPPQNGGLKIPGANNPAVPPTNTVGPAVQSAPGGP
jgi:hypothetical protein